MTKKRHAKLLRAFITRVHEYGVNNVGTYSTPTNMYEAVRMAEKGRVPVIPSQGIYTRSDFWKSLGKSTMGLWGMGDIKEVQ